MVKLVQTKFNSVKLSSRIKLIFLDKVIVIKFACNCRISCTAGNHGINNVKYTIERCYVGLNNIRIFHGNATYNKTIESDFTHQCFTATNKREQVFFLIIKLTVGYVNFNINA